MTVSIQLQFYKVSLFREKVILFPDIFDSLTVSLQQLTLCYFKQAVNLYAKYQDKCIYQLTSLYGSILPHSATTISKFSKWYLAARSSG